MSRVIDLRLTNKQAFALYDLVRYACRQGRLAPEEPLAQVAKKLQALDVDILCAFCGERPATKKGRCHPCYMRDKRKAS